MRLTNAIRDRIKKQESDNRFRKQLLESERSYRGEFDKIVAKRIPENITDDLIKEGWIRVSSCIRLTDIDPLEESEAGRWIIISCFNSYPSKCHQGKFNIEYKGLVKSKIENHIKLCKEQGDYKAKLSRVLYSFATVKTLLKEIPELKKYFPETENMGKNLIPFDDIKDIRKELKKAAK